MVNKVVVIGAGVVGTATACTLLREGWQVSLVDKGAPGEYCSWGNAGILSPGSCVPVGLPGTLRKVPQWLTDPLGPLSIRPAHLIPLIPWLLRFSRASRIARVNQIADGLRALLKNTIVDWLELAGWARAERLIRTTGYLVVYESERALRDASLAWRLRRDRGVVWQQLDAAAIRDLEPALGPAYAGGMLLADHGFVSDPGALTKALAVRFGNCGGHFRQTRAMSIRAADGKASGVVTEQGFIEADAVVICAGVHSTAFSRPLGDCIPIETQRGYHVQFAGQQSLLTRPVMSGEGTFFLTPMDNGLRVAGAVEFSGLEAPPNFGRAQALAVLAKRMLPQLDGLEGAPWMGHRPCTPDTLPVIGPARSFCNVVYAFGHGHLGLGTGAATAQLVGDILARREPAIDLAPYSACRF